MADRKNTPFTNEHFAAYCEKMLGQPYWFGTVVYKCTKSLRSRKAVQYPSHYGSDRTARYKQDVAAKKVCADCIGGAKGYAWASGGIGVVGSIGTDKTFSSAYGSNGCPDKGAKPELFRRALYPPRSFFTPFMPSAKLYQKLFY